MIHKSLREFKRRAYSNSPAKDLFGNIAEHTERVRRETWFLLWFIPLYTRDTLVSTNM